MLELLDVVSRNQEQRENVQTMEVQILAATGDHDRKVT